MVLEEDDTTEEPTLVQKLLEDKGYQRISFRERLFEGGCLSDKTNLYDSLSKDHRMKGDVVVVPTEIDVNGALFDVYEGLSQDWQGANVEIRPASREKSHHQLLGVLRAYKDMDKDTYVVPVDDVFKVYVLEE